MAMEVGTSVLREGRQTKEHEYWKVKRTGSVLGWKPVRTRKGVEFESSAFRKCNTLESELGKRRGLPRKQCAPERVWGARPPLSAMDEGSDLESETTMGLCPIANRCVPARAWRSCLPLSADEGMALWSK